MTLAPIKPLESPVIPSVDDPSWWEDDKLKQKK